MPRATRMDFYDVDSLLTEEEIQIRDAVGDWVDERFLPIVEDAYDEAYFPKDVIPELAGMGLFGATLPEKYGCAGIGPVAYGLTMQELERGDSGLRSFASVQGSLCMYPIFAYGSEEQREKWLPRMAKGEVIGCFGLTEPDFGSDPGGMITRAKRVDGGYVLNGAKMWITNGTVADSRSCGPSSTIRKRAARPSPDFSSRRAPGDSRRPSRSASIRCAPR